MGLEALDKRWMKKAYECHDEKGVLYDFGIKNIGRLHKDFYDMGLNTLQPYSEKYTPNPFIYQYDLCIFIWINYYRILKTEIKILREEGKDEAADSLMSSNTLYGMERHEFLFLAGEMRWPTTILGDGSMHGLFIHDPWADMRARAVSDEHLKYIASFGGGGQGKTHFSTAFGLMLFDHYMFTLKGARCMISTVNEDKMNSAAFSYLCNLNSSTVPGISLSAGKARIAGGWTLARPQNKDKAGVFKGILIGNQMNKQSIIDKLTGSHGHPFLCYIIDEVQSTPDPPIMAAPNFTMHAKDYRIIMSGNYGENDDTLAKNIEPPQGWDSVDEHTGQWISTTQNGSKAIVMHFNNNNSPGMTKEGAKKWPHLPNQTKLERQYPLELRRNLSDLGYRRFWVGWRSDAKANNCLLYEELLKENKADLPLQLSEISDTFYVFDSAQAEIDRNPVAVCYEGICSITNQKVFGPKIGISLRKSTESIKYYRESTEQLLAIIKRNNIKSGHAVHDWTGRPAQPELLAEKGFQVEKLIYNKGLPDGKAKDKITGRQSRAIKLGIDVDFKGEVNAADMCAHHVAETQIGFAAFLLRQYVMAGRIRGINEAFLNQFESHNGMEKEIYSRKFNMKASSQYGDRIELEQKKEFRKRYGFSPDVLDLLLQMAWYAFVVRKIPLTPVDKDATINDRIADSEGQYDDISEMYSEDFLCELG